MGTKNEKSPDAKMADVEMAVSEGPRLKIQTTETFSSSMPSDAQMNHFNHVKQWNAAASSSSMARPMSSAAMAESIESMVSSLAFARRMSTISSVHNANFDDIVCEMQTPGVE